MSIHSIIIPTCQSDEIHTSAWYELRELADQLITCRSEHIKVYTQSAYLNQNFSRYKIWRDQNWLNSRQQPIKYAELWKRIDAGCIGKTVEIIDAVKPYRVLLIGSQVTNAALCEYAQRVAKLAAERGWQIITGRSEGFEQTLKQAADARGVEVVQPDSLGEAIRLADRAVCAISSKHKERDNIIQVLQQHIRTDVLDFAPTF